MDNNNHIQLGNKDHIDKDTMIRYVNDQLSAREKHRVEKHVMDCGLCSDALEGLMEMKNPSALKGILDNIDRRVLAASEKKTGPTILWMDTRVRVAVAAGAALLIGAIWFFNRNLDEAGADKTVSQTLPVKTDNPVVTDSVRKEDSKPDEPTGTTGKENVTTSNSITVTDAEGSGGKTNGPEEDGDKLKQSDAPKYSLTETNRKDKAPSDTRSKKEELKKSEVTLKELEKISNEDLSKNGEVLNNNNQQAPVTVTDESQKILLDPQEKTKLNEQEIVVKTTKDKKKNQTEEDADDKKKEPSPNTGGSYGMVNIPPKNDAPNQDNKTVVTGNTNVAPKKDANKEHDGYYKQQEDSVMNDLVLLDSLKGKGTVDGVEEFNGKKYADAEVKFRQTLKKDPKNRESLYYLGATYLEQDKPALAIEQFDKVIALGKGAYYDESRYKKSEALMKQGKKTEAKKILQDLIKEGGPMKPKAVDLEKK
jgi:tetratricopeptide (TPR) repeat protein